MRRIIIFCTLFVLSIFLPIQTIHADSATHDWQGTGVNGNNMIDIDDFGGSFNNGGNDNSYYFTVDGVGHTATLTLILFDGLAVDDGVDDKDNGGVSDTGGDFTSGSGLQILEPPSVLNPPITEIGALSDNPLTPISFQGSQTGLDVQMLSYVQENTDFVIFEYVVTNNTASSVPVKIGLVGDFDVNYSSSFDNNGHDLSLPVVFEYDSTDDQIPGFYYAAGIALAGGTLDNYRLGACCDITWEDAGDSPDYPTILDAQRLAYFNARPNEECDGGSNCSANCLITDGSEVCGNGVVEPGEGCDDGNVDPGDGCDENCLSELCGDGNLDPGEECDDENFIENDGCSSFCTVEFYDADHYCGDGIINDGGVGDQVTDEQDVEVTLSADLGTLAPGNSAAAAFCVVGGISTTDGPNAGEVLVLNAQDCIDLYQQTIAICGDGTLNAGEECDDGNLVDDDGCDSNCTIPACGNGIVNVDEECDDGNTVDGDGCSSACTLESECGNGVIDTGEECDDGNNADGDGCSALCTVEEGFFSGSGCQLSSIITSGSNLSMLGLLLGSLLGITLLRYRRR